MLLILFDAALGCLSEWLPLTSLELWFPLWLGGIFVPALGWVTLPLPI